MTLWRNQHISSQHKSLIQCKLYDDERCIREYQKSETLIKQQIKTFNACWELLYLCILIDCLYNLANVTH